MVQLDSDGDGVNDAEDAFKFDANESVDSDNDGVADRWDAFPEDPARSQAEVEESGNGMLYAVIALLVVGLLGGGGYFYNRKQDIATSPFADATDQMDAATEQNMGGPDKALPSLESPKPQQWEENGVHWSGTLPGNCPTTMLAAASGCRTTAEPIPELAEARTNCSEAAGDRGLLCR